MRDEVIRREILLKAQTKELDTLLALLQEELEKVGCPMEKQMAMEVCAEEIFVNIASYAYAEKEGTVHITVETEKDRISLCFQDQGIPYDPLKREDPDTTLPEEERQIGGLGIFMVKNMMDEVSYEYKDGFNCLTMVMRW